MGGQLCEDKEWVPIQWRNQFWQSLRESYGKRYSESNSKHWFNYDILLEEGARKRCSECGFPSDRRMTACICWAVQAGLLTPLTFVRHRLSPLAAFTSGAYFLHNGRRWQKIFEFYTANFKGIFEGPYSECVWQQAITCCSCYRMPQNTFFSTNSRSSGQPKNDAKTLFSVLHPLSAVIFVTATVVEFVLLRNSRFSFHCCTQREAKPTQKSARKRRCDL